MRKKMTPINTLAVMTCVACSVLALIILISIHKENNIESIDTTESEETMVMATKATMTVPVALEEMPKPDPKPLYTRRETLTPVVMMYQTSAKTYMDYRSITDPSSDQYRLIHSDEIEICEDGFLRDKDGYIGVALGSKFGEIGSRYICYLSTGETIKVIKVEAKADAHTIEGFCGSTSYEIVEFVINSRADWMRSNIWGNGYIFSGNFNNYEPFNGDIVKMDKVEKIF